MKRFAMFLLCAALICFSTAAFAQDDSQLPDPSTLPTFDPNATSHSIQDLNSVGAGIVVTAKNASANGTGIPIWSYQVTSPVDGGTYTGIMVGRSPFARGARTTAVPTVIIPVIVEAQQGFIMNPASADGGCLGGSNTALSLTQGSPIMQNSNWIIGGQNIGSTQYVDADQRASFWLLPAVGGTGLWHTLLGPVTVAPTQTIVAPGVTPGPAVPNVSEIVAFGVATCGNITTGATNRKNILNVMDINFWDPFAEQTLANLHVPATSFALFVFYDTVMTGGPPLVLDPPTPQNPNPSPHLNPQCCILGYHSDNSDTSPNLITTYGNAEFDRGGIFGGTKDTSVMAHEVSEWMDDPLGNNPTPLWGHVGQVGGCQGNLETGDPLSGTLMPPVVMPNGFTYHLQELAFFSWFFRQSPSLGVNNMYSTNGTFATGAGPVCH